MDRERAARQVVVGAVVFIGTFVVLIGLTSVVANRSADGTATASPLPSLSPVTAVSPSAATQAPPPSTSSPAGPAGPPSDSSAPSLAPSPTGDPILIGAGDIADCSTDGDAETAALLDDLPGTIFTAGDNVYENGTPEEYATCYEPTWGRHLARTRPAPGNHDRGAGSLDAYLDYFGSAAMGPGGVSWYSYDVGTWHVVVLDSSCELVGGCDPTSPQGRWLAGDLAASRATCTLGVWHHPRFSSGERHGSDPIVDPLWRALYAAGADVIVNGHDHDYERFAPQDPDGRGDRARGIRQFVVGTGGTSLRGFNEPVANSELRLSVAHGLLELTLRDGGYDWRFIPTVGDVSDRGTASCH